MKKKLFTSVFLFFVIVARPQQPPAEPPGKPHPPTIEQRIKRTNEVIEKDVQPTADQKTKIEKAFRDFFTAADKLRAKNPPPPADGNKPPSPPAPDPKMKEAMDKLVKERDESIKKILNDAQYNKYKEAVKKLQPPGPGGPPPPQQ